MVRRPGLETVIGAAVALAIVAVYWVFMRPGVIWADDWATYIQDAINLLHGNHYSRTGYLVNPDLANIGPTAYPPLFPITLTLPIAVWGMDFAAMQRFILIFWAVFLIFVYLLARTRLSFPLSLLVLIGIGLSPYFFMFKDFILSEALFLALLYVTFVLAEKLESRTSNTDLSPCAGAWLGLMIGLCVATRTVGLILLPSLVVYDFLRFRRLRRGSAVALGIAALALVLQLVSVDFFTDYLTALTVDSRPDMLSIGAGSAATRDPGLMLLSTLSVIGHRLSGLATEFSRAWSQGSDGSLVERVASAIFGLLAAVGFVSAGKQRLIYCDVFAGCYAAMLLVLPPQMALARMEMPLMPLFYIYVVMAVARALPRIGALRPAGLALVVGLGLASYWNSYRNFTFRGPLDGIETSNYANMFNYITEDTPPGSVFIFDKPRTLALFTHRHAAAIYGTRKGAALIAYMHKIGAQYILFYDGFEHGRPRKEYVQDYLGPYREDFEHTYESGPYSLFKIKSS